METIFSLNGSDIAIVFMLGSLSGMSIYRGLSLLCTWFDQRAKAKALNRWRDISPYRSFTNWAE